MRLFDDALRLDREGQIEQSARLYEEALGAGARTLDLYLNLAILYWQSTDPGFSAEHRLGLEFIANAGSRFPLLLTEAGQVYQASTEVRFWQKYISWADLGESFALEDCRQLLLEDRSVLIPAMFMFAQSQGKECRQDALELLRQCQVSGTTRARYVVSVIEGVLKRSTWRV